MCTETKQEVMTQVPQVEAEPKAEPDLVKVGATKQSSCCDPDCGPSTCGG
jgi:hypothetical protein